MNHEKFSELAAKEFMGEISPEEAAELSGILSSDPFYKKQYYLLKEYFFNNHHRTTRSREMFKVVSAKIAAAETQAFPVAKKTTQWYRWAAAAAAVLIMTLTIGYQFFGKEKQLVSQTIETARATKKNLVLSDGTSVTLNAGSKLVFPESFGSAKREVSLVGEAFFDVHHDAEHPFIIHTGRMDVKVLGTAFNVKAYPDDSLSETTLLRGKVEIMLKDRPADRITLKPSEKIIIKYDHVAGNTVTSKGSENSLLTQVTHLQMRDSVIMETAWVDNKIVFKDETFGNLAKRLERAFDISIVFTNNDVKNLKFSGTFGPESIREILDALRLMERFNYIINKDHITIQ